MGSKLTGMEVLRALEIVGGQVVSNGGQLRGSFIPAGTPVPIVERKGHKYYRIFGEYIAPPDLIRTLREQDAGYFDRRLSQRKPLRLDARDMEVYEKLRTGRTLASVGEDYGVSRQRIKQIADKLAALGHPVSPKKIRRAVVEGDQHAARIARYGENYEEVLRDKDKLRFLKTWMTRKRTNAFRRGVEFSIVPADILPLPENCPALGIPLVYGGGGGGYRDDCASIDRIDPSKGYVRGNVIVVSFLANRIKTNATPDQVRKVGEFYCDLLDTQNNENP